jgi:glycosyltransferase involved in cell wall biosynthesis
MKRAYYIDTFSIGHVHEMFDASSLLMFSHLYNKIDYYARRDSFENVSKLLNELPNNVRYHRIWFLKHNGRFPSLRNGIKQVLAVIINVVLVLKAPKHTDVIINYNTVLALYLLNYVSRICKKRILVICHGEMQDITDLRPVSSLFRKSIHFFDNNKIIVSENIWFTVLGECIYNNLLPLLSGQIKEKLLYFDHTAIFCNRNEIKKNHDKIILGYIGGVRNSKGIIDFIDIAKSFKGNEKVEFRIIGNTAGRNEEFLEAGIVIPNGIGPYYISREILYDNICQLDYAVYCFPSEGYKYTASGSVFDAINCEIPILSLKNDYFENLFSLCGPFGYLENTSLELINRINMLIDKKDEIQSWNFKKVKLVLSPRNAAIRFGKTKWFVGQ